MEDTYIDSLDPEKLLQCPYDKNHQIRACRFPYHLIKCRKNHPDVANKLATCPFNARHQVPRAEINHHISNCDDKSCIEQDVVNQTRNLGQETLAESTWQCPPCDEDWDKDLWEQNSTPFVWGTASFRGNNSYNDPIHRTVDGIAAYLFLENVNVLQTILWSIRVTWLQACEFPNLCHMFYHGKNNGNSQ